MVIGTEGLIKSDYNKSDYDAVVPLAEWLKLPVLLQLLVISLTCCVKCGLEPI